MALRQHLLAGILAIPSSATIAQYNQQGMMHLSIGTAIGAHATELEGRYQVFGFTVTETNSDGAATVTFPIQLGYALGDRFTLGLLVEPGSYVPDTASTDQRNGIVNLAIEPRFYIINADRIAWHASMQLGGAALHITDKDPEVDARYSGGAFGLGTGLAFGLGGVIGLGFDLRFMSTRMDLKAMEINGASVTDFYQATLRTGGVVAQFSLAFRFGGG